MINAKEAKNVALKTRELLERESDEKFHLVLQVIEKIVWSCMQKGELKCVIEKLSDNVVNYPEIPEVENIFTYEGQQYEADDVVYSFLLNIGLIKKVADYMTQCGYTTLWNVCRSGNRKLEISWENA